MPLIPLPIGAGINLDTDDSTLHDGSSVAYYNCYIDRGNAIKTIPGCVEYADLGTGPGEEVFPYYSKQLDVMLAISSGRVWAKIGTGGTFTELTGAVLSAGAVPSFTEDGTDIFFAADGPINKYGATITQLGGNAPDRVTGLAYIGGYILAVGDNSTGAVAGDTYYSDDKINGYALWEVYNNESRPDGAQALVVAYEQVYNIGRASLEVTYIDGTVPFSVNKNASQHFGTPAAQSVAFDGESIYYISEVTNARKVVKLTGGGAPQILSFPIDLPIEQFESVSDARGFIMAFKGQNFYALDFPTANVEIDEQFFSSVTFAYHIQKQQWLIFAKWNADQGQWESYRGCSFVYAEPWGVQLIGGRDGKLYQLSSEHAVDYVNESVFTHRWRDDGRKKWSLPRTISLGVTGDYSRPRESRQNGRYIYRQHELCFSDLSDAGEQFRALVKSGHINHQADVHKVSNRYVYNVVRGKHEFTINTISEDVTLLRR